MTDATTSEAASSRTEVTTTAAGSEAFPAQGQHSGASCSTIDPSTLFAHYTQIHENIQFADQKALFLLTVNGALLSATYSALLPRPLDALMIAAIAAWFALSTAICYCVAVIKPRGDRPSEPDADVQPGVVDAYRIHRSGNRHAFLQRVHATSPEQFGEEIWELIHHRSWVHCKKYMYLRQAVLISAGAWALTFIVGIWMRWQ
jgi:hypothetical protein